MESASPQLNQKPRRTTVRVQGEKKEGMRNIKQNMAVNVQLQVQSRLTISEQGV